MSKIEDQINLAPDQGDIINDDTTVVVVDDSTSDDTINNETDDDDKILLVDDETIIEDKEPTVKELMERINNQDKQIDKANKRTGYLQRKLDRPGTVQAIKPAESKPAADDFETNDEFVEALTEWKIDERGRIDAEAKNEQYAKDKAADFQDSMDSGPEKYADFEDKVRKHPKDGGPQITQPMVDAMMEGDKAADVAYWLAENVKESERIARLSPIGVAREIGRIEERFAGGQKQTTPQKTKTKTITPSSPVNGKTSVKGDLDSMETKDFMAERNKADGVA